MAVNKRNSTLIQANSFVNGKLGSAIGGINNQTLIIGSAGGGGAGDLVSETFEGAGTPVGWTVGAGTPNFDQSTAGLSLQGSQCLYLQNEGGVNGAYVDFTASDNVYATFL